MNIKMLVIVCLALILVAPLTSALDFGIDNFKKYDSTIGEYGKVEVWDGSNLFFDEENKLADVELVFNTENCGEAFTTVCRAIYKITTYESGKIINDFRLEEIKSELGLTKSNDIKITIRDELYPTNKTIEATYDYSSKEPNTYFIELEGYIESGSVYDHQVKVFGKWLDEYALWNGINSQGLLAWYTFNNTINDTKGETNMTLVGTITYDVGKYGNAGVFIARPTVNYLYNVSTAVIPPQNNGTVEAWIKINDTTTRKNIWSSSTIASNTVPRLLIIGENQLQFDMSVTPDARQSIYFNGSADINTSAYVHVAATWNNTNMSVWINGVSVNSTSKGDSVYPGIPNGFCIGIRCQGAFGEGDWGFNGTIDELMLWNFERNASEIQSDMALLLHGDVEIRLVYPDDNTINLNETITFSGENRGLGGTLLNTTLYLWHSNGSIYKINSTTITGTLNITNMTLSSVDTNTNYSWNFFGCVQGETGFSTCKFNETNYTLDTLRVNSYTYNTSSYDTSTENFVVNLSYNSVASTSMSSEFTYDGTTYDATSSGGSGEIEFTYSLDIDLSGIPENRSFYWNFSSSSINVIKTQLQYQKVNKTIMNRCNATLDNKVLNITFLDEETLIKMGAQIDTSTFTYWLGDGSIINELIYANLTNTTEYNFCTTPDNQIFKNNRTIQYSSLGYPQRRNSESTDLSSTLTHKVLYLLSSADGVYSTIQVLNQEGDRVLGAEIIVERQFSGVWTEIGREITDSSGSVTFWLNPDYDHRFTTTHEDCSTTIQTVRPTQSTYTIQLNCEVTGGEIYISSIEGLKWSRLPADGIIENKEYNFTYQLVSSNENIQASMFHLVLSNGTRVVNVSSPCTPSGCTLSSLYTVLSDTRIKGHYYVDIGNGPVLIEADAHWVMVNITKTGSGGLTFFQDFKFALDSWGDNENTKDFNRLVTIFFILCFILSAANYFTGFDTANPGAFLGFMTVIVFAGSICNGITGEGFFYFNNFTSVTWVNNYILLVLMIVISIGLFLKTNRRR